MNPAADPRAEMPQHSPEYRTRRFFNWFPLGLTYALLYMGRYNLTVSQTALGDLMPKADFGEIFSVGAWVYALSFLVNGPLTDKLGGKRGMLIGTLGACVSNLLMGLYLGHVLAMPDPKQANLKLVFTLLYGLNMYFQSYGAGAIVKVNAHWFHVRERGVFSGIFGAMISAGLFLAFDVNERVLRYVQAGGVSGPEATRWVFLVPALLLAVFFLIEIFMLKDTPSQAGFADFDTHDASSGEGEAQPAVLEVLRKVLTHPVILTIALVQFCTGVVRNGVMHWFKIFAKEHILAGQAGGWTFTNDNWGLMLMVAGITGGMFAGIVSDKFFQSRRAPAAGFLYGTAFVASLLMIPFLQNGWALGLLVFVMSICVIGTHGMLSGTATMDFGGRKGAATAVGIIDGFVYLGAGAQSLALGILTTRNWYYWPAFMAPFALIGFLLLLRIWDAKPMAQKKPIPIETEEDI
ncbi:MAG: MFS transporter [Elusimicrobia bacterium]|nr:MFS transporter [Elusimicrobiota bacterium]